MPITKLTLARTALTGVTAVFTSSYYVVALSAMELPTPRYQLVPTPSV